MKKKILLILVCLPTLIVFPQTGKQFDSFGGYPSLKGQSTGWFHVEMIGGRWFFITPEGNAFFSLGVTHAVETIRQDELNLWETRYQKDETRLAALYLDYFREWGYNSSGYGPLPAMEKHIPYVATIWTEGPRSHSAGTKSENSDIFDPEVQKRLKETVRKAVLNHRENKNCLGYVFIDLPIWGVLPQRGISYVDFIRSLSPGSHGKTAYVNFLKELYKNDLQAFLTAYPVKVNRFDELALADLSAVTPRGNQKIYEDDEAFLNVLADEYYRCVVTELRKADPYHLVLGDRIMAATLQQAGLRVPDSILKTAAKYVDVISFQPMGTPDMKRDYFNHVYEITGKPILLADVNTMTSRPTEGQTDAEQYEREAGEHTLEFYLDAAESPAVIGIHRCTVRDYRPWDTNFHRRGLLKADDTPYPILVEYTKRTNRLVYELVYKINQEGHKIIQ